MHDTLDAYVFVRVVKELLTVFKGVHGPNQREVLRQLTVTSKGCCIN